MPSRKLLGFWDVFSISAGAMISSGLFVLPGIAFEQSGPAVVFSYAIASLMMIPALLSQCELATAMPKTGGAYFFIERSMGSLMGTISGLSNWFSLALKSAFALVGIGAFAKLVWPDAPLTAVEWDWVIKLVAVGFCIIFMVLNCYSVEAAGRVQIVLVAGLIGALVWFVVAGMPSVQQHPNFDNFFKNGWQSIFGTAGFIFISYGGLTHAASVADEVKNPGKNLPYSMIAAYLLVSLLYVASVFVVVGVLDPQTLGGLGENANLTPLSSAAKQFSGNYGLIFISTAAMLAFITTGNGGILAAARSPLAMSQDKLLPKYLSKLSDKRQIPVRSVVITSIFMITMILLLDIESLVKVASTMMLILFLLINLAVIIMRSSKIQNYSPKFKSPLYPWVQLLGIVLYTGLVFNLIADEGVVPLLATLGFVLCAVIWYVWFVHSKKSRESALIYLVNRAVSKAIYRTGLEDELRSITKERDEIVYDRFDHLIKDCPIVDLQGPATADEVFDKAAELLTDLLNLDKPEIIDLLRKREDESSTVIMPGLAIPHIVVPGHHLFEIAIIRCKQGAIMHPDKPYAKAIFILAGSADERNYHLRALMSIATIVQQPNFSERWDSAASAEHLRDIMLTSNRKRHEKHEA